MALIIRSSDIHAAGCYTTTPIRKGQRVVEYDGKRIPKDKADVLYADRHVTYLFCVGDGTNVIDGFGQAMFINHSCNPNCETIEDDDDRIFVVAIRNIKANEELTYEYNLYDSGDEEDLSCYCGAKRCRGTMLGDEELQNLKKLAMKKKAAAKKRLVKSGKKSARRGRK
jgi:SET domain-containing protein